MVVITDVKEVVKGNARVNTSKMVVREGAMARAAIVVLGHAIIVLNAVNK